ncbi:cation:proton antiporter [Campylobacter canadensis]|uniref:Cation:proton antiporter n=1 Tax=Campylobacter canadensis TaxID=449520 RepID=A0ABS7WSY5_9BACT|nr:cation:proton antiporter [Campylobacter canadensis]MBZ7987895.1 cation:proton antiporter [Campylobacter canadensis]MBZ7995345.1 cation:proton antiporter [Campylobacter canadensis]MBZ7996329.1 cation:proton antiporter [Campylobacter canadensis]MBZ7998361.1 cation:proton antiporter [Campylobacter canadensis]MBZ8000076.1 cation:proton antiporter [Campylobacter canadensis]
MHFNTNDLHILLFISFVIFCSPYISKVTKLPTLAVEIILGAIAGAFGIISKTPAFELASSIGFSYLMFIAGLEVSLRDFFKLNLKQVKEILFFYIILYALSTIIAFIFNLSYMISIILPIMSVGLISILYKDYKITPNWLNLSMISAALGEVISIIILTLINSFSSSSDTLQVILSVLYILFFLCVFLFIYYIFSVLFWWFPALKEVIVPNSTDKAERDIRFSISLWIVAVALVIYFDFEIALGAFLAGIFISSFFGHKKELEHKLSSLGHPFLIPIFFIFVGLSLDFSLLNLELILLSLSMVLAMAITRLIASFVFYSSLKLECILLAFSTCMPLTLLIAFATLGQKLKLIDSTLYIALILAALIEGVLFMYLIPKLALLIETKRK